MRELLELDYYAVLEIKRDASSDEIEHAYRVVKNTYESSSLALYSLYGEQEAHVVKDRIDEAYQILSDGTSRSAYDRTLNEKEPAAAEAPASYDAVPSARESSLPMQVLLGDEEEDEEAGEFDGARLRRARLRVGVELDQIAEVTKVSIRSLQNIEEENFEDLPANVYVRGFVMSYARTIGLDADRVAVDYMTRVETSRTDQGRSRFLGRR